MLKSIFCRPHRRAPAVAGVTTISVMAWLVSALWPVPAYASRRPGAPRPLRLIWPQAQQPGALLLGGANEGSNYEGVLAGHGTGTNGARGNHPDNPQPDILFFTRQAEGTRNIWRAEAQPLAGTGTNADGTEDHATRWPSLAWPVAPVTRFAAPFFAAQPAITPDGRTLLCVTNAFGGPGAALPARSQIARLDLTNGRWTTLTPNDADDHAPAMAPDGRHFAFVSSRSGLESIYVMPIEGGPARRIVTLGRTPCWLDNNTLLFENVRPGQTGLYRLTLPVGAVGLAEARPSLLFERVGQATSAPDSHELCVAAAPDPRARRRAPHTSTSLLPQLYLLAADGAGARAIPGTEGAGAPHFTPDGSAIIYDAPLDNENSAPGGAAATRTLWLMPMLRVPPTARLLNVKPLVEAGAKAPPQSVPVSDPTRGALVTAVEVLGTAFAEGSAPVVKLEYGEGSEPTRWQELPVLPGTVQEGRLATWKLPPGAQGEWTLRLTVTDATHDQAQATLPITLPVYAPLPEKLPATSAPPTVPPPLFAGSSTAPGTLTSQSPPPGKVTRSAVATTIKPRNIAPPKAGTQRAGATHSKPLLLAGAVKNLPLPALPPAPTPVPPGNSGAPRNPPPNAPPQDNPPANSLPTFPQDKPGPAAPPYVPPDATPGAAHPTPKPPRKRRPPRRTRPPRGTVKAPSHSARSGAAPYSNSSHTSAAEDNSVSSGEDAARLNVVGTPAIMETGQNANVSVTLRNTGTRAWATESGQPVRLVYRWVDATTGVRTRWAVRWLQGSVAPGRSAELAVTVAAPPRPGRYRLTYLLVRLNGDKFEPPPTTAPGQRWPGEFGGITYGVTVRAGERPTPLPPERER